MGILVLRGQLARLCEMAAAGESPEKGGEFVADELPDELLGYLELPNILDILAGFNGEVRKHPAWFDAARKHAVKLLNEPEPPTLSSGG